MRKIARILGLALPMVLLAVPAADLADAKTKAKKQLTAAERKKYHAAAMNACRKHYGGYYIERVEINWTTLRFVCYYR